MLSLREMAVDVGIARGYARVNVRQVFENHTGTVQEGTYRFALPPSARGGRLRGVGRPRAHPGRDPGEAAGPGHLPGADHAAHRPGPAAAGRGGGPRPGSRAGGGPPLGRRALLGDAWRRSRRCATKRLELQFQQEVPFMRGQGEFRLALRPADGEPPVARQPHGARRAWRTRRWTSPGPEACRSGPRARALTFTGTDVRARPRPRRALRPPGRAAPLRLSAFRNPDGALPDGLALAPWERPSEIPPEKDGFFLLEVLPPAAPGRAGAPPSAGSRARRSPWPSSSTRR